MYFYYHNCKFLVEKNISESDSSIMVILLFFVIRTGAACKQAMSV